MCACYSYNNNILLNARKLNSFFFRFEWCNLCDFRFSHKSRPWELMIFAVLNHKMEKTNNLKTRRIFVEQHDFKGWNNVLSCINSYVWICIIHIILFHKSHAFDTSLKCETVVFTHFSCRIASHFLKKKKKYSINFQKKMFDLIPFPAKYWIYIHFKGLFFFY